MNSLNIVCRIIFVFRKKKGYFCILPQFSYPHKILVVRVAGETMKTKSMHEDN
jgi:hypothetical protein